MKPMIDATLPELLKTYKNSIHQELVTQLAEWSGQDNQAKKLVDDIKLRLDTFTLGSKAIRGSSCILMYHSLSSLPVLPINGDVLKTAVALELFGTALLIHDDIMDQDRQRRGGLSIHAQYTEVAHQHHYNQSDRWGESMGMCVGDIGLFWSTKILSTLSVKPEVRVQLLQILSQEAIHTGVGQMMDISLAAQSDFTQAEIISLYWHKTARYTFCLPLLLAGALAQVSPVVMDQLERLGVALGIVFQIKDDELGLLGKSEQTGKPVGSDVREGKKTLFYEVLWRKATPSQRQRLQEIFGNSAMTPNMYQEVVELVQEHEVVAAVNHLTQPYVKTIDTILPKLPLSAPDQDRWLQLVSYLTSRQR